MGRLPQSSRDSIKTGPKARQTNKQTNKQNAKGGSLKKRKEEETTRKGGKTRGRLYEPIEVSKGIKMKD